MASLEKFLDIDPSQNAMRKYVVVKDFLNENDKKLFYSYAKLLHQENKTSFDGDNDSLAETLINGNLFFDCLLESKRKLLEEISGKKLLPLISIMKVYINKSTQKPYRESPHRQLTCQINLGTDSEWETKIDDETLNLKPGDAMVYCGNMYQCEKLGPLKGDHYINLDLMYCEDTPANKQFVFDCRSRLGAPCA